MMQVIKQVIELLYPHVCPFCGQATGEEVCEDCKKVLVTPSEPRCFRCGKPIRDERREYCRDCEKIPKTFKAGSSLWIHKQPVSGSIYRFKYQNRRIYAEFYAQQMVRRCGKDIKKWGVMQIVPIPLHWRRRIVRGYNQSELIAVELGRLAGIPVELGLLVRRRYTKAQKTLGRNERGKNLHQAFQVLSKDKLKQNVLLLDDIYTTGSTIEEATKVLKKSGVSEVHFLTISIGQEY